MFKKLMGLVRPKLTVPKYEIAEVERTTKPNKFCIHIAKDGQRLPRSVIVISTPSSCGYYNY